MQTVLKNIPDERLKVYIIWLPVLPADNLSWAEKRSMEFSDSRVQYFWDGDQLTGQIWSFVLGLDGPLSWDTYFLYGPDAEWGKKPGSPDFWMHQLSREQKYAGRFLNSITFEEKTRELLRKIPGQDE